VCSIIHNYYCTYTKNDSERRRSVCLYIIYIIYILSLNIFHTKIIKHILFFSLVFKIIYFTNVGRLIKFFRKPYIYYTIICLLNFNGCFKLMNCLYWKTLRKFVCRIYPAYERFKQMFCSKMYWKTQKISVWNLFNIIYLNYLSYWLFSQ